MEFKSKYQAKEPDSRGYVAYTPAEDKVWQILYERQVKLLPRRACQEYMQGIEKLQFNITTVPQLPDIDANLQALTGWGTAPVTALISSEKFFSLLASRRFPVATFIRSRAELDYVTEPDIFHELFGHCPMLTDQAFADFVQAYAQMALDFGSAYWPLLLRFFWFTVEFGLINTPEGLRTYGGGILSSREETVYCIESDAPERKSFDPVEIFRTPYRIDMLQPVYYVIDSYQQLYDVIDNDIKAYIEKAKKLGELPPLFPVELDNPAIYMGVC